MANLSFSFANCLRHAFFEGAGYGDLEKIKDEDQRRWCSYDPPRVGSFISIESAIEQHGAFLSGLRAIVERADNCELGSSKVQDMRRIAADLLASHGGK